MEEERDEDSLLRKRRLQEMRTKSLKKATNAQQGNKEASTEQKPLKFRNYQPYDTSLVSVQAGEVAVVADDHKNVGEDVIKRELALINSEEVNVVPKKSNWDLKSQVAGNLDKLKRRTQRAIVDILRDRLREER
jgi:coiled-coil domain-containing protein 12